MFIESVTYSCLALQPSAMYWSMNTSNQVFRSAGAKNFIDERSL
jgi:hypothetical protein